MWYAFILACGSSTDNFAVGFASGISNRQLHLSTNLMISFLLKAMGAYVSAASGHMLGVGTNNCNIICYNYICLPG